MMDKSFAKSICGDSYENLIEYNNEEVERRKKERSSSAIWNRKMGGHNAALGPGKFPAENL